MKTDKNIISLAPVVSETDIETINNNFKEIQENLQNKELSLNYLDLYNISENYPITKSFSSNQLEVTFLGLPLNSAIIISKEDNNISSKWRKHDLNNGDIILKIYTDTEMIISGPKAGLWKPTYANNTLTWQYSPIIKNTDNVDCQFQSKEGEGYIVLTKVENKWDLYTTTSRAITLDQNQTTINEIHLTWSASEFFQPPFHISSFISNVNLLEQFNWDLIQNYSALEGVGYFCIKNIPSIVTKVVIR